MRTERETLDSLSSESFLMRSAIELRDDLYRFTAATVRDRDLADDIVQETLLRAHRESEPVDNPRAWCFAVTLNLIRSHFRRRRFLPLSWADRSAGWDVIEAQGVRRDVHRALGTLRPEDRSALLLHILAGFSYAEIAGFSGTTEAAVKQRVYRARDAFRRAYQGGKRDA